MMNDDRITKFYKKICEKDDIDYQDFCTLDKRAFFKKYPKIMLKPKSIKVFNYYHDNKLNE